MAPGRCAGCGLSNSSCRPIRAHVETCPDYLDLYREDPARALAPEAEYRRWKAEDDSPEARQAARDVRLGRVFAEADEAQQAARERWQSKKSILDD